MKNKTWLLFLFLSLSIGALGQKSKSANLRELLEKFNKYLDLSDTGRLDEQAIFFNYCDSQELQTGQQNGYLGKRQLFMSMLYLYRDFIKKTEDRELEIRDGDFKISSDKKQTSLNDEHELQNRNSLVIGPKSNFQKLYFIIWFNKAGRITMLTCSAYMPQFIYHE